MEDQALTAFLRARLPQLGLRWLLYCSGWRLVGNQKADFQTSGLPTSLSGGLLV